MKAKVYQQDGKVKGEFELPAAAFGADVNEALLHEIITLYRANQRQGTAKTKGRSEVSGGGKKPWKQKGTGRARAGSNTSPIWVRGGKAHGPDPRDYYTTIPKKMRKLALQSALSSRAKDEKIMIIDNIVCEAPKTKTIAALLKALSVNDKRNLLVVEKTGSTVFLSGRNVKNLNVKPVSEINAFDIISNENIIFGNEQLIGKIEQAVAL